jgi:hypothetical protein
MGKPIIPVLPAQIAEIIRAALAAGWNPKQPGKPFLLDRTLPDQPAGSV